MTPPTKSEIRAMRRWTQRPGRRYTFTPEDQLLLAIFGNDEQRFWLAFYQGLVRLMDPDLDRRLRRREAYDHAKRLIDRAIPDGIAMSYMDTRDGQRRQWPDLIDVTAWKRRATRLVAAALHKATR